MTDPAPDTMHALLRVVFSGPERQAALLQRARALLSDLEWAGTKYYDAACCPCCHGLAPTEHGLAAMVGESLGHCPDCEWNAILTAVRPTEHKGDRRCDTHTDTDCSTD